MQRILITVLGLLLWCLPAQTATTRYVSSSGTGTTCSGGSPCSVAQALSVMTPGDITIFKGTNPATDGHYKGANYMIQPTVGLKGTASARMYLQAETDGKVWIDGQGARAPIALNSDNDYWTITGMNYSDSNGFVVRIRGGSDHNEIKRFCAWNAESTTNVHVIGIDGVNDVNLFEDFAAWGTGRKILSASQGGNYVTYRRGWVRWEYSTRTDPKLGATMYYNTHNTVFENMIFTQSQQPGTDTSQLFGVLGGDRIDGADRRIYSKALGSIIYIPNGVTFGATNAISITKVNEVELKDVAVFLDTSWSSKVPASLQNCKTAHRGGVDCTSPAPNLAITNASLIGRASSSISAHWTQTNVKTGANVAAVYTGGDSIWKNNGSTGATVCKQYVDGVLTDTPLFDSNGLWPMNQRIINAMTLAGVTPVNVTTTLTSIFGAIDDTCKLGGDSSPPTSIMLTSPDAGGTFVSATVLDIEWQTFGITGNVDIEVSRDGGALGLLSQLSRLTTQSTAAELLTTCGR